MPLGVLMSTRMRTHGGLRSRTGAHLVVPQQEGQQHEHASVVHDPPDVNAALGEALRIPGKHGNVLGDQQGQVSSCSFPDQFWRDQGVDQKGKGDSGLCDAQQSSQRPLGPSTLPTAPLLDLALGQKTSIFLSLGLIQHMLFGSEKDPQPHWTLVFPPVKWQ